MYATAPRPVTVWRYDTALDHFLGTADALLHRVANGASEPSLAEPRQQTMDPRRFLDAMTACDIVDRSSAAQAMAVIDGYDGDARWTAYRIMADKTLAGSTILYSVEKTRALFRHDVLCYRPAWQVEMRAVTPDNVAERAYLIDRPASFTCCCFYKPTIDVFDVRGLVASAHFFPDDGPSLRDAGQRIASFNDPWAICDLRFRIQDDQGDEQLFVTASGFQPALCCPCTFPPCASVDFEVSNQDGEEVGVYEKSVPMCSKWCGAASQEFDGYSIRFAGSDGKVADVNMKLALVALGLYIDFRFFGWNKSEDSDIDDDGESEAGDLDEYL